jgi:iron complex transport system substrate-binding protein
VKLISAAPSNTEILFNLGKGGDIVATTSLCDHPEEARRKDSIGGWSKGLSVEKIVEHDPDLVFTSDSLQDEVREGIEEKGISTVHVAPESLEEVYHSILKIGRSINEKDKAREIVEEMKEQFDRIDLQGAKVYCEEWSDPQMISGNWFPEMVGKCNGKYPISEGRSREIDVEKLKDFNPDIAIMNICGAGNNPDVSELTERENWKSIRAVKEGNVYAVDDSLLNRPGPRLVEGMRKIEEIVNQNL